MFARLFALPCLCVGIGVISLNTDSTYAADKMPHVTGMFTSLQPTPEGGDLEGYEMWIVPTGQGFSVVLQPSIDFPIEPVIARAIVDGDRVSFVVPPPSDAEGTYQGRVTARGFDGTCSCKDEKGQPFEIELHLKRKQTYWQIK